MPQSLNQITDSLLVFLSEHGQLATVRFCDEADLLDKPVRYPCFVFDLTRAQKIGGEMSYSFSAIVADLVQISSSNDEPSNTREVLSDSILIAADVLAFLNGDSEEYWLDDAGAMTPFSDDTAEGIAGVRMEFTVKTLFANDRCAIPYKPEEESFYIVTEEGDMILTESSNALITD